MNERIKKMIDKVMFFVALHGTCKMRKYTDMWAAKRYRERMDRRI